jgi:adenosine deaminase
MFGTSLAEEYMALCQHLGFTRADIRCLIEQGIETSWLPRQRKAELLALFRIEFSQLDFANP